MKIILYVCLLMGYQIMMPKFQHYLTLIFKIQVMPELSKKLKLCCGIYD
jgi:hypothetical protein